MAPEPGSPLPTAPEQKHEWALWYVMKELERLGQEIIGLRQDVRGLREDMVALKVKSGLWGSGAGIVAAALVQFLYKAVLDK